MDGGRGDDHRYVFEEAGAEVYEGLLGTYLSRPQWIVRFLDFGADPEERVEELRVHVDAAGEPLRLRHILPEARPGARLDEEDARVAALAAIQARYGMGPESMDEVGAVQTARPERTDWRFTFEDRAVLPGIPGEARLTVLLAGDEVVDAARFVNVPEEWELARADGEALRNLVNLCALLVLVLGFAGACILSVVTWARRGLDTRLFVRAALLAAVALGLGQANSWPATEALFSPAQPWGLQAGIAAFGSFLGLLFGAGAIGLGAALARRWLGEGRDGQADGPVSRSLALALGAALLGVVTLAEWIAGGLPAWPDVPGTNSFIPILAGPLGATAGLLFGTTGLLLMSGLALRSGARWRVALWVLVLAAGILSVPGPLEESILTWVPAALLSGAVFFALARLGAAAPALVPGFVGTLICADFLVQVAAGPYPGARLGARAGGSSRWARLSPDGCARWTPRHGYRRSGKQGDARRGHIQVSREVMHYHLIGIAGTAMASLAGLLRARGDRVTGSDQGVYPPMSLMLDDLGIEYANRYDPANLAGDPDMVVVGNAISGATPNSRRCWTGGCATPRRPP